MPGTLKLRLSAGSREIEIEGDRKDVDELLAKWWTPAPAAEEKVRDTDQDNFSAKSTKRKSRPARTRTAATSTAHEPESAYDSNAAANQIKERSDFGVIERRILHTRDRYNKTALILYVSEIPLTSGQIHRTLEALDVRISLPHVSSALKGNMSKFLTSAKRQAGGPPASYRLSAQAKAEFENWLRQDGQ